MSKIIRFAAYCPQHRAYVNYEYDLDTMEVAERTELLSQLIVRHDLTYEMSDDHSAWRAGHYNYVNIRDVANTLPRSVFVELWNAMVRQVLRPGFEHSFLMREDEDEKRGNV